MQLRQVISEGGTAVGAWMYLSEPLLAEAASLAGYDYVCVDLQHGTAGLEHLTQFIQAIAVGGATPLVRVAENQAWLIGKALDAGAMGVIVPMVNTPEEAARAVAACRYAPQGSRSVGPVAAMTRHGQGYVGSANDQVFCAVMIETADAVSRVGEILAVPGVDAAYIGPADLSLTLGLPPGLDQPDQSFRDALAAVVEAAAANSVVAGIHSTAALCPTRHAGGFRMITVSYDHGPVMASLRADLKASRDATTAG